MQSCEEVLVHNVLPHVDDHMVTSQQSLKQWDVSRAIWAFHPQLLVDIPQTTGGATTHLGGTFRSETPA
jgi:hypothetical protein